MKHYGLAIFLNLILLITADADNFRYGEIRVQEPAIAWSEDIQEWVSIEQFWMNYAQKRSGITWGKANLYSYYSHGS